MADDTKTEIPMDYSAGEEDMNDDNNDVNFIPTPSPSIREWTIEDVKKFLHHKIGRVSKYVFQYLPEYQIKPKKNFMSIPNTAKASLRCSISAHDTAMLCSEFLKDFINTGHLSEDMRYLACDSNKIERARKHVMVESSKNPQRNIVGIGYDGRKDKNRRALLTNINGNT